MIAMYLEKRGGEGEVQYRLLYLANHGSYTVCICNWTSGLLV